MIPTVIRATHYLRLRASRLNSFPTATGLPPPLPYQADQRGGHSSRPGNGRGGARVGRLVLGQRV